MAYLKSNFSNANGITFGTQSSSNGNVVTASYNSTQFQTTGNYLTTARASNDAVGLNTAQTNVTWTVNSSGISLNASGYAGTGTTGTNATFTLNSNGLQFNAGAYLTTAALSNHSHNFATTTTNGSLVVVATTNSAGATIAVPPFLTTAQAPGAYLTTARASNDAIGLNTAQTNVTWTVNSSGISFNASAYLTTAALSNHSHNFATTTTNGASIIVATTNSNGATIAVPAYLTTAQPVGAYLTTARASNDGVGLNTAQTNVTWTVNSSGISFNAGGYAGTGTSASNASITMNSNGLAISVGAPAAGVGIAAGTRTATTAGNLLFDNANGISFGLNAVGGSIMTASHNGLTTARASNDAVGLATAQTNVTWTVNSAGISFNASGYNGTGFTSTTTAGTEIKATNNTAGLSMAVPTIITNALTTARASNDAIGLNTAQTNITWTVNSSGISFNAGGYAGTTTGFAGNLISGSMTHNTAGLNLSLSHPGWLTTAMQTGSQSQLWIMGNSSATVGGTNISGTMYSNGLSLSAAGPGGGAAISNYWAVPPWAGNSQALLTNLTATAMTQRPFLMPFQVGGSLTAPLLKWVMSRATSGSNAFTVQAGVYSYVNRTSIALIGSNQHVFSNTATASISGIKQFQITMGTGFSTLPPGQYFLGMNFSAAATASMNYSLMGVTTGNLPNQTVMVTGTDSYVTVTSNGIVPFWGRYSTTTNAMPAGFTYGQVISQSSSNFQMNFTLGQSV